jgi:hypothetical protein
LGPLTLTFRHRAGVTPYTAPCGFAGSCVFGKQSLGPAPAPPSGLVREGRHRTGDPFSRSYGVNLPSSLARTHSSPLVHSHPATSGGLRYGRPRPPAPSVSGRAGSIQFAPVARSFPRLLPCLGEPGQGHRVGRSICALRWMYRPPHWGRTWSSAGGNGISTVCPSPTPFGLGLGPTNPPRMNLAAETSAIRWERLLTFLTLLMPAFSLPSAPPPLTGRLRCTGNAPLPPPNKLGDSQLRLQA